MPPPTKAINDFMQLVSFCEHALDIHNNTQQKAGQLAKELGSRRKGAKEYLDSHAGVLEYLLQSVHWLSCDAPYTLVSRGVTFEHQMLRRVLIAVDEIGSDADTLARYMWYLRRHGKHVGFGLSCAHRCGEEGEVVLRLQASTDEALEYLKKYYSLGAVKEEVRDKEVWEEISRLQEDFYASLEDLVDAFAATIVTKIKEKLKP